MRVFLAFFKKELLESARSGKFLILGILFFAFGVMNPAIAKLTPWMMEMLAEELAASGMTVGEVAVDALTSWTQFFKNIPMALIAFVFLYSSSFTKEYESGTLVLMLTRGLARRNVVLAKAAVMELVWSAGYFLCFGVTYGYNAYYWDNSIAVELMPAVMNWWLFGVFTVALLILFSTLSRNSGGVLLGTGGCVLVSYLVSMIPKAAKYLPTALMNSAQLLTGVEKADEYTAAVIITAAASVICIALAVPILDKKQI
ncbi:MAG: ABC transporter permease subunit [Clostridia bacterium]|nr:ABC transporter permease subunit [Clostridia bacterium]